MGGRDVAEQLLTVPEAAARLRLSRTATYELVLAGKLPSLKIGKARRVREDQLDEFIRRAAVPMSWPVR
jgi:excisionase family DNA binding protein